MKYPPVKMAADWQDKLKLVPIRAWWAENDEPILPLPDGDHPLVVLPYNVALRYGVVDHDETLSANP